MARAKVFKYFTNYTLASIQARCYILEGKQCRNAIEGSKNAPRHKHPSTLLYPTLSSCATGIYQGRTLV